MFYGKCDLFSNKVSQKEIQKNTKRRKANNRSSVMYYGFPVEGSRPGNTASFIQNLKAGRLAFIMVFYRFSKISVFNLEEENTLTSI